MMPIEPGLLFTIANLSVLPFWLLLAIVPGARITHLLVHSLLMPLLLGALYIYLFTIGFVTGMPEGGGFGSLKELMVLFTSEPAVLAGWVHYLVFDLFVGAWIARDAVRRGFNRFLLIVCLFLTLMAGPIGLLLYGFLRAAFGKGGWQLAEAD